MDQSAEALGQLGATVICLGGLGIVMGLVLWVGAILFKKIQKTLKD